MVSEEIACGRFSLGQMLSETMIAQELGVSRTPVREAFSHLEFRGLLITKPQSGTYVFDANEAAIKDLFEVSSCMEMQGLQSALQNDESALPKLVSEISEQMTDAFIVKDQDRYSALDRQFHRVFVASSGNKLLTSLYDPVSFKIQALAHVGIVREPLDKKYHEEHLNIAIEIARKGMDATRLLFSHHLDEAKAFQQLRTVSGSCSGTI
jgi:DNA-binding GntR family transcriptional regulator